MFELDLRLLAVHHILQADPDLKRAILPFVNYEYRQINWRAIQQHEFSECQSAALRLAQALWCDKAAISQNPFLTGLALDSRMRTIALQALAIYWGLIPGIKDHAKALLTTNSLSQRA